MNLTIEIKDEQAKTEFKGLMESLTPEQKLQVISDFMTKIYLTDKTGWDKDRKGDFNNFMGVEIAKQVKVWVENNTAQLRALVVQISVTELTPERLREEMNKALVTSLVSLMAAGIQNSLYQVTSSLQAELGQRLLNR